MACCVCIGVSCCEAAVRGGRVEIRAVPPPPPACCHKSSRQACRRQARTFPPCCCCCNKHNERLRNAHFIRCPPLVRCSSLARPPSPTPHTRHTCILYIIYILCIYSSIPHTTLAAAAAASHHHPPRRRSRPTISAQYYRIIIRRHVIEYVGTWMEHHRSQREEKGAAATETNVMYDGSPIYI